MRIDTSTVVMARPVRDNWSLGKDSQTPDFSRDTLVTTSALVDHPYLVPDKGTAAAYTYQRDCKLMQPAQSRELYRAALNGAAMWGGMGAALGATIGTFAHIYSALGSMASGYAQPISEILPLVGGLILGGAAVGATYGAVSEVSARKHEHRDYPKYGETVHGQLSREDSRLFFQPNGDSKAKIDLTAFAKSPVTAGGEMGSDHGLWWQQATPNVCYDDLGAEIARFKNAPA